MIGPEYARTMFPNTIELCGVCGDRIYRAADAPYCYHCGHGAERPTVDYIRTSSTRIVAKAPRSHGKRRISP